MSNLLQGNALLWLKYSFNNWQNYKKKKHKCKLIWSKLKNSEFGCLLVFVFYKYKATDYFKDNFVSSI